MNFIEDNFVGLGLGLITLIGVSSVIVPRYNTIRLGIKGLFQLGIRKTLLQLTQIWFPKETTILLHTSGKSVRIGYHRCGKDYMIVAPYRRDLVSKMSGTQVWSQKGDERIEITQQPGIPYLVSANMMGADRIIVKRGGIEMVYVGDVVPNFD